MKHGTLPLFLFLVSATGPAVAQLVTNNTAPYNSAAYLVNNVLLDGVTATNITFQGQARQIGYFTALNTNLGIDSGLVMSTGDIADATGPNGSTNTSVQNNGVATFPPLQALAGVTINDMALLQFDFQVTGDSIKFNYVFGSEEYPEFVNSINDVFGFFLSGPIQPVATISTKTLPSSTKPLCRRFRSPSTASTAKTIHPTTSAIKIPVRSVLRATIARPPRRSKWMDLRSNSRPRHVWFVGRTTPSNLLWPMPRTKAGIPGSFWRRVVSVKSTL